MLKILFLSFSLILIFINNIETRDVSYTRASNIFLNNRRMDPYDDDIKRRMLSLLQVKSKPSTFGISINSNFPYMNFHHETSVGASKSYDISISHSTHPYLFKLMEFITMKSSKGLQYILTKMQKLNSAFEKFNILERQLTPDILGNILFEVFPDVPKYQLNAIAEKSDVASIIKEILSLLFPSWPRFEIENIVGDSQTVQEGILNILLYMCPQIKAHFLWDDTLPITDKFKIVIKLLFPGISQTFMDQIFDFRFSFKQKLYNFINGLFSNKLQLSSSGEIKKSGPEWNKFNNFLKVNNIDTKKLSPELFWYLYREKNTADFKNYLETLKLKNYYIKAEIPRISGMSPTLYEIWMKFLQDLKNKKTTFFEMPSSLLKFIQNYSNPQEVFNSIANYVGVKKDPAVDDNTLDPVILSIWKKYINILSEYNGDTSHVSPEITAYFNSLIKKPDSYKYAHAIFNPNAINSKFVISWNNFLDKLRNRQVDIKQMPDHLLFLITLQKNPIDFLRDSLPLKNININLNNLDVPNDIQFLWKQFIADVSINKENLYKIPQKLLNYFYQISSDPEYLNYINLLFEPKAIEPQTLSSLNTFVNNLKLNIAELQNMPQELIEAMMKYKDPTDFFKLYLPTKNFAINSNVQSTELIKKQWMDFLCNLKDGTFSKYDIPKEFQNYLYEISYSPDYKNELNKILPIRVPQDVVNDWNKIKNNELSLDQLPTSIRNYLLNFKTPRDFLKHIFEINNIHYNKPILEEPIDLSVQYQWNQLQNDLKEPNGQIRSIPHDLLQYLDSVSNDLTYKQGLNDIFKMDNSLRLKWEQFINDVENGLTTICEMPNDLKYFLMKFPHPDDFLRFLGIPFSEISDISTGPLIINQWQSILKQLLDPNCSIVDIPEEIYNHFTDVTGNTKFRKPFDILYKVSNINKISIKWDHYKLTKPGYDLSFTKVVSSLNEFMNTLKCSDINLIKEDVLPNLLGTVHSCSRKFLIRRK